MTIRTVLFDLEGTLIDGAAAHERALDEVFQVLLRFRPALKREELERQFAGSLRMSVRGRTGVPVSPQAIYAERFKRTLTWLGQEDDNLAVRLGRLYASLVLDRAVAYPDALAALPHLARLVTLIVVANGRASDVERQLKAAALQGWITAVIAGDDPAAAKPAPALVHQALHATGTAAAEGLVVGDSPETDIAAGRAAGVPTAWLNRSGRPWPEGMEPPDQTIHRLTDLL